MKSAPVIRIEGLQVGLLGDSFESLTNSTRAVLSHITVPDFKGADVTVLFPADSMDRDEDADVVVTVEDFDLTAGKALLAQSLLDHFKECFEKARIKVRIRAPNPLDEVVDSGPRGEETP